MRFLTLLATGLCSLLLWGQSAQAGGTPAGTEFNYQGLLKSGGAAVNDDVDIKARLYDAETDGTQIGTELELLNVPVTDGVFSIELNFGSVFAGAERWLELEVKLSADLPAAYEILSPRQKIKPSPFSLFSLSTGLIPDGSLAGTYNQELQLTNVNNTVAGDGSGLTNISAGSISGGTINNSLNLTSSGNSFTGDGGGLSGLNWSSLIGVPVGFADGIDNDTTVWSTTGGDAYYNAGNVGIGTSSPTRKLFVEDGSANTFIGIKSPMQTGILFGNSSLDTDGGIVFNNPSNPRGLDFRTSGNSTRMSIDDLGNVGIGTTSPAGRLDIGGQTITDSLTVGNAIGSPTDFYVHSTFAGVDDAPALISVNQWDVGGPLTEGLRLSNRNLTGAVGLGLLGGANNVTDPPQVYLGTFGGSGQNNFRIATNNAGTMRDRVFVDGDSGNVGIGTTSPSSKLEVRGDSSWPLWVTGTTNAGIRMESDGTSSSWAIYHESSTDNLSFRDSTTGATRMSIRGDNGNVGIGTTNPQSGLSVDKINDVVHPSTLGVHLGMIPHWDNSGASVSIAGGSEGAQLRFYEIGGDSGLVRLWYQPSTNKLRIDGEEAFSMFSVPVLEIRGGADIVEGFDTSHDEVLEPGTVVVIDPDNPGALMQSADAYDFKVAGVVSGAGGVAPGIHLGQDGVLDGDTKVAMTGRVYVKCSTENGAIVPGDLLTTASLTGHAMKATDRSRSHGAVIGKAMSTLDEETGLVLVLVNLQ